MTSSIPQFPHSAGQFSAALQPPPHRPARSPRATANPFATVAFVVGAMLCTIVALAPWHHGYANRIGIERAFELMLHSSGDFLEHPAIGIAILLCVLAGVVALVTTPYVFRRAFLPRVALGAVLCGLLAALSIVVLAIVAMPVGWIYLVSVSGVLFIFANASCLIGAILTFAIR